MNTIRYLFGAAVVAVVLVGLPEASHAAGVQCGQNASANVFGFRRGNDNYWCRCTFDSGNWVSIELADPRSRDLFADFCRDSINAIREKERLARENQSLTLQIGTLDVRVRQCRSECRGLQEAGGERMREMGLACLDAMGELMAANDTCGRNVCEVISHLPPLPSGDGSKDEPRSRVNDLRTTYDCPEEEPPVIEGPAAEAISEASRSFPLR